mmetsp:Transcript_33135/g.55821  ORF Transcript_33135/g.55821 Transcript_33135/m.55821 type:complete len:528 (-) Transcript_33135:377-1960(-)
MAESTVVSKPFTMNARDYALIILFAVGYVLITLEHVTGVNKGTIALAMAVFMWVTYFATEPLKIAEAELAHHLSDVSNIVYFLLAAVTIVELMDLHGAFRVVKRHVKIRSKKLLLVFITSLTFFLSCFLDNLTTTIGMVSLLRTLLEEREDRLIFGSMVVIAANAGGAWTVIGDVTTTMLWIGDKVSIIQPMKSVLIPSLICAFGSMCLMLIRVKGTVAESKKSIDYRSDSEAPSSERLSDAREMTPLAAPRRSSPLQSSNTTLYVDVSTTPTSTFSSSSAVDPPLSPITAAPIQPQLTAQDKIISIAHEGHGAYPVQEIKMEPYGNVVLALGIGCLVFVPVFKIVTHLPPYMGILLGLSVMWLFTDWAHGKFKERRHLRVINALSRIDISSILFFLGILLAVSALSSSGLLKQLATLLDHGVKSRLIVDLIIGFLSAVVDNVPLVAASINMYDLPMDHEFWLLLAYSAGTGGSMLIIGSAAGVAFMGLENVNFFWYLKNVTWIAALGYLAGFGWFILQIKMGFLMS